MSEPSALHQRFAPRSATGRLPLGTDKEWRFRSEDQVPVSKRDMFVESIWSNHSTWPTFASDRSRKIDHVCRLPCFEGTRLTFGTDLNGEAGSVSGH